MRNICTVEGCGRTRYAYGLCRPHHRRVLKYGDHAAGKAIAGEPARFLFEVAIPYTGDDCLIWPFGRNLGGYGCIYTNLLPGVFPCRTVNVHRVVCEHVHGKMPSDDMDAAHTCGKGHLGCCNPKHLMWKTRLENIADRVAHGTETKGERNGAAKLSAEDVREIKRAKCSTNAHLAEQFGVGRQQISRIRSGDRWGWLT
jgi:hypothetical protein